MLETWVQPLGRKDSLEKEMATLSSILACDRACVQYQEVFLSPLFCLNVLVSFSYEPCRQASPAPLVNTMAAQSVLWTLWFKKERCFFPPIKSLKKKKKGREELCPMLAVRGLGLFWVSRLGLKRQSLGTGSPMRIIWLNEEEAVKPFCWADTMTAVTKSAREGGRRES